MLRWNMNNNDTLLHKFLLLNKHLLFLDYQSLVRATNLPISDLISKFCQVHSNFAFFCLTLFKGRKMICFRTSHEVTGFLCLLLLTSFFQPVIPLSDGREGEVLGCVRTKSSIVAKMQLSPFTAVVFSEASVQEKCNLGC